MGVRHHGISLGPSPEFHGELSCESMLGAARNPGWMPRSLGSCPGPATPTLAMSLSLCDSMSHLPGGKGSKQGTC